jgi:hypothetical protein
MHQYQRPGSFHAVVYKNVGMLLCIQPQIENMEHVGGELLECIRSL